MCDTEPPRYTVVVISRALNFYIFMNSMMGWVVAAVVIVAAGVFYFWPQLSQAPATQNSGTEQQGTTDSTSAAQRSSDVAALSGTWRSNTDAKFTREFRADGVIYDRYEGDASAGIGGSWGLVLDATKEPGLVASAASLIGKTVIKATWEDGAETTYFVVNSVSGTTLTTTDLSGNGKVTIYTKVQ